MAGFQANTNKYYIYKKPDYLISGKITFVPVAGHEVYQFCADFFIKIGIANTEFYLKDITMDGPAGQTVPTTLNITNCLRVRAAGTSVNGSILGSFQIAAGATRGDVVSTSVKGTLSSGATDGIELLYRPTTSQSGTLKPVFGNGSEITFYLANPIKVNNNLIDTVYVNGTKLDSLYVNGTQYHENHVPNQ